MIDFNSDYERSVFDEAYNEGKRDGIKHERKRILKLIDEKIKKLYLIDKKVETLVRQELEDFKKELKEK